MTAPGTDAEAHETLVAAPTVGGQVFEHGTDAERPGQRRALGSALDLNGALLILEVAGGIVFGSLALLADAAHLVSDVAGLAIALGAVVLTARPVSVRHSFGCARADVVAAQVSALLLLAAGGWILLESTTRLADPVPVDGAGLAAVATVGLVINRLRAAILAIDGVTDVHHLHLWNLASDIPTLSAHVVIAGEPSLRDAQHTIEDVRTALTKTFGMTHMTLEIECAPIHTAIPTRPNRTGTRDEH